MSPASDAARKTPERPPGARGFSCGAANAPRAITARTPLLAADVRVVDDRRHLAIRVDGNVSCLVHHEIVAGTLSDHAEVVDEGVRDREWTIGVELLLGNAGTLI